MYKVTTLNYRQSLPEFFSNRYYFHNIARDDMYYSGNIALESVIQ
jgi:hypothetical protein